MLDGGGAPLSERLLRSNQKIDIEEIAALLQKPHVGSNQKTEREELAPTMQKPLAGSNQKTQTEQLRQELQDAGVLSVRTPTGARTKASLATTNPLPATDPYAAQFGTNNIPQPLAGSNQKTQTEQIRQELQDTRKALHTLNMLYARAPLSSPRRSAEPPLHPHHAYDADLPITGGTS